MCVPAPASSSDSPLPFQTWLKVLPLLPEKPQVVSFLQFLHFLAIYPFGICSFAAFKFFTCVNPSFLIRLQALLGRNCILLISWPPEYLLAQAYLEFVE